MQTERVTILMTPARKAQVASRAAARGISMGEYLRRKVEDDDEELTPEQEVELIALTEFANEAIPRMAAAMDDMSAKIRAVNDEVGAMLRAKGYR